MALQVLGWLGCATCLDRFQVLCDVKGRSCDAVRESPPAEKATMNQGADLRLLAASAAADGRFRFPLCENEHRRDLVVHADIDRTGAAALGANAVEDGVDLRIDEILGEGVGCREEACVGGTLLVAILIPVDLNATEDGGSACRT